MANEQHFDAIVIGAGFGGLYALKKLRDDLGLKVRVYDKAGGVAGDTPSGFVGIGDASVIYRSGTINVLGNFTSGIFASADVGSATITTLPGTSITVSQQFSTDTLQPGVDAFSSSGTATATVASTILINGNPTVPTTNYKSNPTGIRATSDLGTAASVTYSAPALRSTVGAASASLP